MKTRALLLVCAILIIEGCWPFGAFSETPPFATKESEIKAILGAPAVSDEEKSMKREPGATRAGKTATEANDMEAMDTDGTGGKAKMDRSAPQRQPLQIAPATRPAEGPRCAALVLFKFDSTEILEESQALLDEYGRALTSPDLGRFFFYVDGHTDSVGGDTYNDELSRRRAFAVVEYLCGKYQIPRNRLLPRGQGERRPIRSNASPDGRKLNRRVEFIRLER
jgi:outer membrane protein OmpA-like peptidoglycan-associated protein